METLNYTFAPDLKRGDLCVFSSSSGVLIPGIFWGKGDAGNLQYAPLSDSTLDRLSEKKKPYVSYISGYHMEMRVAKISETSLTGTDLAIYQQIKQFFNENSNN